MNNKTIKPGAFQTGRTKGGLNLNKFVKDLLVSINFATVDETLCCTFYPTFPVLTVTDACNVTAEDITDVPVYGIVIATDGNATVILMKTASGGSFIELASDC